MVGQGLLSDLTILTRLYHTESHVVRDSESNKQ